jgi:hypothetical protein
MTREEFIDRAEAAVLKVIAGGDESFVPSASIRAEAREFAEAALEAVAGYETYEATRASLQYIPGSSVRSWPPGFRLRDEALRLSKAAIAKAESK